MAKEQEQNKSNSRRRGQHTGRRARTSSARNTGRTTTRRGSRPQEFATAPQQDDVLIAPPKYRKGSMRIVPLGGLGEIGAVFQHLVQ